MTNYAPYRRKSNEAHGNSHERGRLHAMTHKEIAAKLNISQQAVHAIERKALTKLRRKLAPLYRESFL